MLEVIQQVQCKVCEHKWFPRKPDPKLCPHCGSANWQTGRVRPPISDQRQEARERNLKKSVQFLRNNGYYIEPPEREGPWEEYVLMLSASEEQKLLVFAKQTGFQTITRLMMAVVRKLVSDPNRAGIWLSKQVEIEANGAAAAKIAAARANQNKQRAEFEGGPVNIGKAKGGKVA